MLCEDCALVEGVIRVRGDLAVEIKPHRLLTQRGEVEVEVFPGEMRHLVDALVEAGVRMADTKRKGGAQPCDPITESA